MAFMSGNETIHKIDIPGNFYVYVPIEEKKYGNLFSTRGKILFNQKDFTGALNAYSMAIVYSYDEQFLARILSNRALVHLKLNNYHFCYIDASEAIKLDPTNSKAYYRQGKALTHLGFFSRARDAYKKCLDLAINDQVAKELTAIENKVNDPQLPIIELDHYIPMEADPELFNRTLFTRDLNLFFFNNEQLVEGDSELVKLHQYGKFDMKKWKSAAKLEEVLFTRVREEIQKKNYEKASIYLWLIESLECDAFEGQMKIGLHPGFAQLNAICCYLSGNLLMALDYAIYSYTRFTEIFNYAMSQKQTFLNWKIYNRALNQTLIPLIAYKAGCYSFVRKIFQITGKQMKVYSKMYQEVDIFAKLFENLEKQMENKGNDICNDQKIILLLNIYTGERTTTRYEEMYYYQDSPFANLRESINQYGRNAWFKLFPNEFVLKETRRAIEREASETVKNQVENNVKSKEGTPYPSSSKNEVPVISFEEKLDKVMQATKCSDLTAKVSLLIFDENVDQAIANITNKSVPDPKPDLLSLIPKFQRYLTCSMLEASYYLRKNHLQLEDASQAYYKANEFIANYFLNHGVDALERRNSFPYPKFDVQEKNRKMIEEEEGINWIRDYTGCDDIECEEAFYDNEEILEKAIATILKKRLAPTSSQEQKSDPVEEDETVKPETKEGSSKTTVETQMETLGLSKDEKNQPKSKSKKKKNKKKKKSGNQNGADAPKTNNVSDEETDEENSENQPKEPQLEKPYKPENTTPKVVESPPELSDPYTSDYEETLKSGYYKERVINRNETGNGFKRIFNRCIDDRLTEVVITDPYVRENHQIDNFKLFCNFIAGTAKNLKKITLKTKEKEDDELTQKKEFELIKYTLEKQYKNLTLTVEISATQEDDTHYRNFKFNNGWSLFTDRGFDMYRRVKFTSVEYLDTELRPCKTTLLIHRKE